MNIVNNEVCRPSDRDLIRASLRALEEGPSSVDVVFGGVVDRDQLGITEAFGSRTRRIQGQSVNIGEGLGGHAMGRRRPVGVVNYFASQEITHEFDEVVRTEGLWSMIAVPIVVGRRSRAVLYGAARSRSHVGERAIDEFVRTARRVAGELHLRDEVDRRVSMLGIAEIEAIDHDRDARDVMRTAHAELMTLANQTDDRELGASIRKVAASLGRQRSTSVVTPHLSRRELEVLSYVALGCTYAEIGARLSLQTVTIKSYMRSVLVKLDCHNRVEAVAIARRLGILP